MKRFLIICSLAALTFHLTAAENDVELTSLNAPYYFAPGTEHILTGNVANHGSNAISSLEISYSLGSNDVVTETLEFTPITSGNYAAFTITNVAYTGEAGSSLPLTATVTKVNGADDPNPTNNQINTEFWSGDSYFERMVVVEEGTGTWCGYCPRGIVGLEYMHEIYPDSFIGIAVHMSSGDTPEPMATSSYEKYFPAETAPICNINRTHFNINPTKENLEIIYNSERDRKSYGNVTITSVEFDADKANINVTTETEFALDYNDNADFKLAYVVLENNVGPYTQLNYYAGGIEGEMGGWENLPEEHRMTYDDVARDIFNYNGIRGSVDYTLVAGQKYCYTHRINLKNVSNTDNMDIVVLLLDTTSGVILNADKLTATEIAGINTATISDNESSPTLYFNLQGMQVPTDRLSPGLYIKTQGQKAEKIIIR